MRFKNYRSNEQNCIRVESSEVELNREIFLPKISGGDIDYRVAVRAISKFVGMRFVRVTAHLKMHVHLNL